MFRIHLPQRLFLTLMRFRRGMTLGVRAVVLDANNRVFLVRHGYTPGWHFPGGGVEIGETILAALIRELEEEGGIVLDGAPELFGMYLGSESSARDHVALFVCRAWREVRERRPTFEIIESGFFARHELPADTTDRTRERLEEVLDGVPPFANWRF